MFKFYGKDKVQEKIKNYIKTIDDYNKIVEFIEKKIKENNLQKIGHVFLKESENRKDDEICMINNLLSDNFGNHQKGFNKELLLFGSKGFEKIKERDNLDYSFNDEMRFSKGKILIASKEFLQGNKKIYRESKKQNTVTIDKKLYLRTSWISMNIWEDKDFYYHLFKILELDENLGMKFINDGVNNLTFGTFENELDNNLIQIEFMKNEKVKFYFKDNVSRETFKTLLDGSVKND